MSHLIRQANSHKRQVGVGLLEVVISIAVLSIGLLGVAHMQAVGAVSIEHSYQRSQATVLAYDIADRVRANPNSVNSYLSATLPPSKARPVAACLTTSGCTVAQMAQNDLWEWNRAMQAALPGAQAIIWLAGDTIGVAIRWDDNADGQVGDADPTFTMRFEL